MKNLKHLFLLLLAVSFLSVNAQTRSEIQTQIETIATGVPNTALKIRNVLGVIADGTAQTGDIKEIDVSTSYIAANFDVTGLGKNERLGWAICNGNNGTRNRNGRVPLQYDPSNYPTLGATGGSKDAVVVAHSHTANGFGAPGSGSNGLADNIYAYGQISATTTVGESGVNKNMQPYIVTLFIMKL